MGRSAMSATNRTCARSSGGRGPLNAISSSVGVAFAPPYAVMNAPVYAVLRSGRLNQTRVRVTGAWALERVWPIFGALSGSSTTSTCVLFGRRQMAEPPPREIDRWYGDLPRRDANEAEAAAALTHSRVPWPRERTLIGVSPYRSRFRQGATIVPRRFFIVDPEPVGRLGARRDAPRMRGRTGNLDKAPWTKVEPPHGPVELQFLRQVALGETIAPFRLLEPVTAVIPLDGETLLTRRQHPQQTTGILLPGFDIPRRSGRNTATRMPRAMPV